MKKVFIASIVSLFTGCLTLDYYGACVTGIVLVIVGGFSFVYSGLGLYVKNL